MRDPPIYNRLIRLRRKRHTTLNKRIDELNPLECPCCRSNMTITEILVNPSEIRIFMRSLGIPLPRAATPIPKTQDLPEHNVLQRHFDRTD
jgi:hypothetical protein